jgi:hypothetical protein
LTDDDLLILNRQRAFEEADNDTEERDNVQVKEFTLKEFEDILRAVEVVKQKIWMLTLTSIEACKSADMRIKHSASASLCMKIYRKRKQFSLRC